LHDVINKITCPIKPDHISAKVRLRRRYIGTGISPTNSGFNSAHENLTGESNLANESSKYLIVLFCSSSSDTACACTRMRENAGRIMRAYVCSLVLRELNLVSHPEYWRHHQRARGAINRQAMQKRVADWTNAAKRSTVHRVDAGVIRCGRLANFKGLGKSRLHAREMSPRRAPPPPLNVNRIQSFVGPLASKKGNVPSSNRKTEKGKSKRRD